jgi:hypothetical protein
VRPVYILVGNPFWGHEKVWERVVWERGSRSRNLKHGFVLGLRPGSEHVNERWIRRTGLTSGTCLGVWKAMWLFMNDEFMVRLGYTRADEEEGLNWETHILGSRILYDRVWEIGSEITGRNF